MEQSFTPRPDISWRYAERLIAALLVPLLLCGSGCHKEPEGGSRAEVVPVTGKILVDGKPVKGVSVMFWRVSERKADFPVPEPAGSTDENGVLTLSTYVSNDGAAPGEYKLGFTWANQVNLISGEASGDAFKGKYQNKQKSEYEVTIPEDVGGKPHDIGTIELSTTAN